MTAPASWLDRLTAPFAPRWTLRRQRARLAAELLAATYYDVASVGRRTAGWRRTSGDANAAVGSGLTQARMHARDLERNNPYATSAIDTIVDHMVSWGITTDPDNALVAGLWKAWAETTACDADGRHDFAGLQKLVGRTVVSAGECLVRRRWRSLNDGGPIPLQLQVIEPDYLDETKTMLLVDGRIIQGVEYNQIGRRRAYWLFPEHPGSMLSTANQSRPVPASEILHVFKPRRPGQVRGLSWFSPVTLRLKDFDVYEDAELMKQKIASCLAIIYTDPDGTAPPLGGPTNSGQPDVDWLEPGIIKNAPPGSSVNVVDPPSNAGYAAYCETVLRAIATGLGVTYEDLTGNYTNMPFSAARMSRLRHWSRVEDWRWMMLIPQFCDPVWSWFVQAAAIVADIPADLPAAEWTAPPAPMIELDREVLGYTRAIRSHLMSASEALRERGYRPKRVYDDIQRDNAEFDRRKFRSDADPRVTNQNGQLQGEAAQAGRAAKPAVPAQQPAAAGAMTEKNGHHAVRAWDQENIRELLKLAAESRPVAIPPSVTIEKGAVQIDARTDVAPPSVTVDARTTIAKGAMVVDVDAPTTIEEGALTVTPPPEAKITVIRSPAPRHEDGDGHE